MKKETLFNRNHIDIHRLTLNHSEVETRNSRNYKWNKEHLLMDNGKMSSYYYKIQENRKESRVSKSGCMIPCLKEVIKESPLGFYYIQYQENGQHEDTRTADISLTMVEHIYTLNDTEYHISYPKRFGDTRISQETRPWMLMDGSMEEHYVNDLLKILDGIKDEIHTSEKKNHMMKFNMNDLRGARNINERFKMNGCVTKEVIVQDWQELMTDLFGHIDGPKYQTNDEKIQSAGFDLKTSFRNM